MSDDALAVLDQLAPRPLVKEAPLTRQIAFIASANLLTAVGQLVVIGVLARYGTVAEVATFSLTTAVTAPTLALLTVGTRLIHLSSYNAHSGATWATLFSARFIAVAAAAPLCLAALGVIGGAAWAIAAPTVLWRASDAMADAAYSELQRQSRGVTSASIQAGRALGALMVCAAVAQVGAVALWALPVLSAAQLAIIDLWVVNDRRRVWSSPRSAVRVLRWGIALGIASAALALTFATPRLFLGWWGTDRDLARYAVAATIFALVSLLTAAVGQVCIPVLAARAKALDLRGFTAVLRRMVGLGILGALVLGVAAVTLMPPVVSNFLGREYVPPRGVLALLAAGLGVASIGTFIQDGLTALAVRGPQALAFGIGTAVTAAVCALLVDEHGMQGASVALVGGVLAQTVLLAVFLRRAVVQMAVTS